MFTQDYNNLLNYFVGPTYISPIGPTYEEYINYFNDREVQKDLYDKSKYKSHNEYIDKEFIRYDENMELIDLVIITKIKKYNYYKKDYIEKLICNKNEISILEYDFLNESNKQRYSKCMLFYFYKKYNKIT
jgi:hypothetical protein